mmetsp:Transcript_19281/g.49449  ORF Transcript_19281/g.49449 Transcript_19281/m.49449 type:complete len:86 (-) Transcript_19281:4026-4283(-)
MGLKDHNDNPDEFILHFITHPLYLRQLRERIAQTCKPPIQPHSLSCMLIFAPSTHISFTLSTRLSSIAISCLSPIATQLGEAARR